MSGKSNRRPSGGARSGARSSGRGGGRRDGGRGDAGRGDGGRGDGGRGDGRGDGGSRGRPSQDRSGQRGAGPSRNSSSSRGGGGGGGGGATKRKSIGGDQIEGRQAVRELLLAGARRPREIVLAADLDPAPILDEITELANEAKVPLREVGRGKFESMAKTDAPQGILAFAPLVAERDLDELVVARNGVPPFLLVVDGVTDPGNLGALLRVAETAGVTGVVLPAHRSARLSPSVTKAAAGAIEYLAIAQVPGIPAALAHLKEHDVWTVGLDVTSESSIFDLRVATDPVALVVGAEGRGLSRLVRERCDLIATIPMAGRLDSLNAATAGAVACFEIRRRRTAESG